MRKLFFLYFSFFFFTTQAQEFADKDFYLLDSLVLDDLDEYDLNLIDSMLTLYHEVNHDTLKLEHLETLINYCWDDEIWPKYNLILFTQSTDLAKKNKDDKLLYPLFVNFIGISHGNSAYLYDMLDIKDKAIEQYELAKDKFIEAGNEQGQGEILNVLSLLYQRNGEVVKAVETAEKSINLVKHREYEVNTVTCYYNMVVLQIGLENYEEAIYFNTITIDLAEKNQTNRLLGAALSQRAYILLKLGQVIPARDTAIYAYSIIKDLEDKSLLPKVYDTWVEAEIALKNYDRALELTIIQDSVARQLGSIDNQISTYSNYTQIYYSTQKYSLAKKYGKDALSLGYNIDQLSGRAFILGYLAKIAEVEGDYKLATSYLNELNSVDEIMQLENVKKLGAKQLIAYKYEKQKEIDDLKNQQQIDLAEEQKQKTWQGMVAITIISSLIGLFSIFIFNRLKLIRKQKKELDTAYAQLEESKKNELAVSNLKALQSQMNPHFIFNALNSVQDLVLLQDIRNSNKYLGKFSDLIRKILLSSKEQFISLTEEVDILKLYLDLEKLRFGDDFEIDFKCEVNEEKQEEILLPAMFIQPYIENAIKHGLFHKQGLKKLKVYFSLKHENQLECIVEDNGIGQEQAAIFKEKRLHLHTGFSTEAINERIRLLNETLDKKIELEVIDLEENGKTAGTKIVLLFPKIDF